MPQIFHVNFSDCWSHEEYSIALDFFVQENFPLVEYSVFSYNKGELIIIEGKSMKSVMGKLFCITLASTIALSCASTSKINSNDTNPQGKNAAQEESIPQAPGASELYSQKVNSVKISLLSAPSQTTKGKIFTAQYIIKIEDSELEEMKYEYLTEKYK